MTAVQGRSTKNEIYYPNYHFSEVLRFPARCYFNGHTHEAEYVYRLRGMEVWPSFKAFRTSCGRLMQEISMTHLWLILAVVGRNIKRQTRYSVVSDFLARSSSGSSPTVILCSTILIIIINNKKNVLAPRMPSNL